MYAEHVLRVRVDWSTLKSVNKKIGQIGNALAIKKPVNIPYEPIPDWFRQNPKLVDEPGRPLPPDRTPKKPRWRRAPQNPIDIVLREVFEAMEMDVEGNDDGQNNVGVHRRVGADEVPHEVPIEVDGGVGAVGVPQEVVTGADERAHKWLHWSDEALAIAQRMLQEKIVEYLADVEAYRARISHLETLLAGFGIRPDGSSSSAPHVEAEDVDRAPSTVHVSMQAKRNAAVEQATTANLNALELSTANQELQRQLEVLRQNPFEAKNQALRRDMEGLQHQLRDANERLADYTSTRENMQKLQEENAKLKEYFHTMLKEHKGMRTSTLLAIARARQYELEFEGIQQERNRNGRMQNMLFTLWPGKETMYHNNWWFADPPAWIPNGSIDWKLVKEADYHWNVDKVHAYPDSMVGQKLWPNRHVMVSNGTVCAYCQSPFGPEGCYQVGSCVGQFHPQCLIRNIIGRWHCPHCRSPYHSRLYLQFGLWDYMPTHLVHNPKNFLFDLHEFDGENVEWSWKYNCSKVQLWSENADGDWIRSAAQITYEMYPNRPRDYRLKRFFYQTLDWHWSEADRALRRGNQPPYYVSLEILLGQRRN